MLAHSRRKSFGIYERSDFYALTDAHVASFARFEGAAEECKYDSQKAVVLGWEANQAIYNPRFLGFSTYYEYKPRACRRFHPNDKPHVEYANDSDGANDDHSTRQFGCSRQWQWHDCEYRHFEYSGRV